MSDEQKPPPKPAPGKLLIELDGKKLWEGMPEFVRGQLKYVALQTNDGVQGDDNPSLMLRIEVPDDSEPDAEPLTVLVDVKIGVLLTTLGMVRQRLTYLDQLKNMVKVVS